MVQLGGIKLQAPIDLPINMPFDTSKIPDLDQIKETLKDPKKLFVKNLVKLGWTKTQCLRLRQSYVCSRSCLQCVRICLSRIPIISLAATLFLIIGYTGFSVGLYEAVFHLNKWLKMDVITNTRKYIMYLGIFLGSLSGLALLHGFAATGRTRYTFYSGWKSKCCGRCCILSLFFGHSLIWLIWTIIGPVLLFPLIFMGIGFAVCQVKLVKQLGKTCIEFEEYGVADLVNVDKVCGYELAEFCSGISPATPYFAVTFVGAIFIIIGVFIMLVALIVNLLQVHKHQKENLPSEWSTCKACCRVEDPEKYDDCWPEPPVEEVQVSMREKLRLNQKTQEEDEPNPHGQQEWSYIYDFEKETAYVGKKY
ncbi:neuronal membrane glycoprotein M6-a [Exaiptasia diaphana]|uniref:Neuronal membrane glycoprotein M6-b n=1 Tax=Exaiptasia diaphana TaxID=2652724 RepID=A0A913Y2D6_EXADI|nr:neuronal membrane glycoprotein M6-a [Exaiptasia diaphana]XP_020914032.1 neuronal membrane glycoprotein M6-a [Exaiptasia diaphana]KXJ22903.1 Neuronal membrane glycoprotein M6-a [Exaiptasia diaphana]KXJ25836.1 Neuronal membrane glycoprotein M6-a [Exaiptasia diaphana]